VFGEPADDRGLVTEVARARADRDEDPAPQAGEEPREALGLVAAREPGGVAERRRRLGRVVAGSSVSRRTSAAQASGSSGSAVPEPASRQATLPASAPTTGTPRRCASTTARLKVSTKRKLGTSTARARR
jgi:hypothetical protein